MVGRKTVNYKTGGYYVQVVVEMDGLSIFVGVSGVLHQITGGYNLPAL